MADQNRDEDELDTPEALPGVPLDVLIDKIKETAPHFRHYWSYSWELL